MFSRVWNVFWVQVSSLWVQVCLPMPCLWGCLQPSGVVVTTLDLNIMHLLQLVSQPESNFCCRFSCLSTQLLSVIVSATFCSCHCDLWPHHASTSIALPAGVNVFCLICHLLSHSCIWQCLQSSGVAIITFDLKSYICFGWSVSQGQNFLPVLSPVMIPATFWSCNCNPWPQYHASTSVGLLTRVNICLFYSLSTYFLPVIKPATFWNCDCNFWLQCHASASVGLSATVSVFCPGFGFCFLPVIVHLIRIFHAAFLLKCLP